MKIIEEGVLRWLTITLFLVAALFAEHLLLNRIEDWLFAMSSAEGIKRYLLLAVTPKVVYWLITGSAFFLILKSKNTWPEVTAGVVVIAAYYWVETFAGLSWEFEGALGFLFVFSPYILSGLAFILGSYIAYVMSASVARMKQSAIRDG